jgi:hypothetical protein
VEGDGARGRAEVWEGVEEGYFSRGVLCKRNSIQKKNSRRDLVRSTVFSSVRYTSIIIQISSCTVQYMYYNLQVT